LGIEMMSWNKPPCSTEGQRVKLRKQGTRKLNGKGKYGIRRTYFVGCFGRSIDQNAPLEHVGIVEKRNVHAVHRILLDVGEFLGNGEWTIRISGLQLGLTLERRFWAAMV